MTKYTSLIILILIWINHTFCFILLNHQREISNQLLPLSSSIAEVHTYLTPLDIQKQYRDIDFIETLISKQCVQPRSKLDLLSSSDIQWISTVVEERAQARARGDYLFADQIRMYLESICSTSSATPHTYFNTSLVLLGSLHNKWPTGYQLAINDVPRRLGGGSSWEIVPMSNHSLSEKEENEEEEDNMDESKQHSVLSFAHQALGLAVTASRRNECLNREELQSIVHRTKQRILESGLDDLRGRKAADAAFWFALAGVTDVDDVDKDFTSSSQPNLNFSLFTALTCFCIHELQRFGKRSSCDSKYILQMVERMAVAGIQGPVANRLWNVAAECLALKPQTYGATSGVLQSLQDASFNLHSPRSLLWIWRFASRQRKQRVFLDTASKHWEMQKGVNPAENVSTSPLPSTSTHSDNNDSLNISDQPPLRSSNWSDIFHDPTLPLVVDLGCGMGVSLLGLSTIQSTSINQNSSPPFLNDMDWSHCNFIGADLSGLAIGYATAIAKRWGIHRKRVYFIVDSAEAIMQKIRDSYPGYVLLITINFPTPFRLQSDINSSEEDDDNNNAMDESNINTQLEEREFQRGNSQLPDSYHSGFMVTPALLQLVQTTLKQTPPLSEFSESMTDKRRYLLVQSNCEDVAVYMKNLVSEQGYNLLPLEDGESDSALCSSRIPKRTLEWIRLGGERATGSGFGRKPLLPDRGATETEIACMEKNTPIYRFMAVPG